MTYYPLRSIALLSLLIVAGCGEGYQPQNTTQNPDGTAATYSLSPSSAGRGTQAQLYVESTRSIFLFGLTSVDLGPGITVDTTTVESGYRTKLEVTIDPDAELGPHTANIDIDGLTVQIPDALTLIDQRFQISPDNGKMGETLYVSMSGSGTDWQQGYTWTSFGDSVEILDFEVSGPTEAVARINIRPDAAPGPRDVALEDGPQVLTLYSGFTVDRAVITAFWEPPEAYQGDTIGFTITGLETAFDGTTEVSFWDDGGANADISVVSLTVTGPSEISGRVQLSNAARLGLRDVLISTADETVLIPDALTVLDSPADLRNVYPGIGFNVTRSIDNSTGAIAEQVDAYAYFIIPLNPPCGSAPPPSMGPSPFDVNGVFPSPPPPAPEDCPNPETVSAGDFVWFEGPENVVTLHKNVIQATGQIIYRGIDLTLQDYHFNQLYDLTAPGDPDGIPGFTVTEVQPTVPADYHLISPAFWGDLTHNRATPFSYEWTPAQTYPEAIFSTGISGSLTVDDGGGFAGALPWDDGEHTYTPTELAQLNPGPVQFSATSAIKGPLFGLPFSSIQIAQASSVLQTNAYLILE